MPFNPTYQERNHKKPVSEVFLDTLSPFVKKPWGAYVLGSKSDLLTGAPLTYTATLINPKGAYGSGANAVVERVSPRTVDIDNLGGNLFFHTVLTINSTSNFADFVTIKVGGSSVVIKNGAAGNARVQVLGVGGGTKTYDVALARSVGDRCVFTGCVSLVHDFYAHIWNITTGQRAEISSSSIPTSFFSGAFELETTIKDSNAFCEFVYVGTGYLSRDIARNLNLNPYQLLKPSIDVLAYWSTGAPPAANDIPVFLQHFRNQGQV